MLKRQQEEHETKKPMMSSTTCNPSTINCQRYQRRRKNTHFDCCHLDQVFKFCLEGFGGHGVFVWQAHTDVVYVLVPDFAQVPGGHGVFVWQAHTDVVFVLLPHFVQVPGGNAEPARILGGPPGQPICVGQTHDLGKDEYLVN